MRPSRRPTWARLRVYFGLLLLGLFVLGGLLVYISSRVDPAMGTGRGTFRILGAELMALAVIAAIVARVLRTRFMGD